MTPRTRSLYAHVGKSHEQYQSPSKDLDLINGRISGRMPHVLGVQVLLLLPSSSPYLVHSSSVVQHIGCL